MQEQLPRMRGKDRRFPLTLTLSPVGGEGIVGYGRKSLGSINCDALSLRYYKSANLFTLSPLRKKSPLHHLYVFQRPSEKASSHLLEALRHIGNVTLEGGRSAAGIAQGHLLQ